jgi:hypothetical protein
MYARIYFGITGGKNFAEILFQGEYQSCCIQLTKLYTAITQVHTYRQATYSASYYLSIYRFYIKLYDDTGLPKVKYVLNFQTNNETPKYISTLSSLMEE